MSGMTSRFADVPIGKVRDYWDRRPCNIRHSAAPVGTRQYFDEVEARKYFVEPHIPAFAEFPRWAGKRVLEIGCGIGTDTINFARAGAFVTAVDLSPQSLAVARQRVEVFGLADRIRVVEANAERLCDVLEPAPYDLVYSFGVIHHSPRPDAILEHVRQHFIAPDGTLKVMVYHRHSWKVLGIALAEAHGAWWRLDEAIARNSEAQTGCPITYTYSRREGAALLEQAGFDVTDVAVDHVFPYRVSDYVQYRYRKAAPFRWLPAGAMRLLERRLGWHLCLTARPR
jgi:2-polyprenyl-3-methyl-5-hydroxy-6-metoxy-1,4-benzoquinol methylase